MGKDSAEAKNRQRNEGAEESAQDVAQDAAVDTSGLMTSYTTDAESGVTTIVFEGRAELHLVERVNATTGQPEFAVPGVVKSPQETFLGALYWAGRNVIQRSIRAEYDRQNPTEAKGSIRERLSKADEVISAQAAEIAAREAAERAKDEEIAKLRAQLGLAPELELVS
jgi:hypothetical protein